MASFLLLLLLPSLVLFRTDDVTFKWPSQNPGHPHSQGWHHVEVTCSGKAANLSVFFASGQRNMDSIPLLADQTHKTLKHLHAMPKARQNACTSIRSMRPIPSRLAFLPITVLT